MSTILQQIRGYLEVGSRSSHLPDDPWERLFFGLVQPILAFRLLRRWEILKAALIPATLLLCFCALVALVGHEAEDQVPFFGTFYKTFALLAPLPSIVLTNHYARLAATAHEHLGLGQAAPRLQSISRAIVVNLRMALVVAVAISPVFLLRGIPGLGWLAVVVVGGLWSLLWIVVEALDNARVHRGAPPKDNKDDNQDDNQDKPEDKVPWFSRPALAPLTKVPVVGGLIRRFLALCDRLCRPWLEELYLCENNPALFFGFAVSTALLLCIPVLNLAFRPVVTMAAVHIVGRLQNRDAAAMPNAEMA